MLEVWRVSRKMPSMRRANARKFGRSTKAALKRSFHPRELIIPSEKLEGMTAQSIYDGFRVLKPKRRR